MLDVHPPHQSPHSLSDFLLHILTITIGLFIALTLESLVEWRHHVHLVHEARATLRSEIARNRDELARTLPSIDKERAEVDKDLATVHDFQSHPGARQAGQSLAADFSMGSLGDTAWKTAQATGALAYMPYEEAKRYADVYDAQTVLDHRQEAILEDIALFQGLIQRYNLPGSGRMTPEAAADFAKCLGAWRTHLVYFALAAQIASLGDEALLEGKPAPTGISEKL